MEEHERSFAITWINKVWSSVVSVITIKDPSPWFLAPFLAISAVLFVLAYQLGQAML